MCRDTVAHMFLPDIKEIDRALGAVPVRHGYIFVVYELVRMAGQEADKAAAIELFPVHCHGELVRASVYNHAIHFFILVDRGAGQSLLVTAPAPPFPNAAFGVPRPRSGHSGAGNLTIQRLNSDDFFSKFAVFFGIVLVTYNCVYIGD